jgi:hypothetical protein
MFMLAVARRKVVMLMHVPAAVEFQDLSTGEHSNMQMKNAAV